MPDVSTWQQVLLYILARSAQVWTASWCCPCFEICFQLHWPLSLACLIVMFLNSLCACRRSAWQTEQNLGQDRLRREQQHQQLTETDLPDPKTSSDQFARYQQMHSSMRRPGRSLQGLSSTVSPPSSPPAGDLDPPLFDFSLFHPDRSRGKNARLPVAVTSTLHSDLPPANDLVLQALLGDATSFAASSASQLPSAAAADRQHIQNSLAQQRIKQSAASATELLQGTGPSFPSHTSNRFPSPPQHLPSDPDSIGRDRAFASLLQLPNQLVSSIEHYEPQGSGRPGRMHGQQASFTSPSQSWVHKPVPSRRLSDFGPAPSPLASPPALFNTQQQQQQQQQRQTTSSIQSMLPWDLNRWGGLPTDVEANVAQSFRLQDQQQQPQLPVDAQRQQQQQPQQPQQQYRMTHTTPLGAAAMDAAQYGSGSGLRHLAGEQHRQQPPSFTFLPSSQSLESLAGFRDQMGSPLQYMPHVTGGTPPAEQFGFPDSTFSHDEVSNDTLMAYSRHLAREGPGQDLLPLPDRQSQLPWGLQVRHASSKSHMH